MFGFLVCWWQGGWRDYKPVGGISVATLFLGSFMMWVWEQIPNRWDSDIARFLGMGANTLVLAGGLVALIVAIGAAVSGWRIYQFRRIFGALPPTRRQLRGAFQVVINDELSRLARNLVIVYREEESTRKRLQNFQNLETIKIEEKHLLSLRGAKKRARKEFYSARNAAKSYWLPFAFDTHSSFKDYLTS